MQKWEYKAILRRRGWNPPDQGYWLVGNEWTENPFVI
jgi:hypothetical protein